MNTTQLRMLSGMLYPQLCYLCKTWLVPGEECLCLACTSALPRTQFRLQTNNPVEKIFHARIPLNFACSFLHFSGNNSVQNMMHGLKYRGQKDLGKWAGRIFGTELKQTYPTLQADIILPVPLHPKKLKMRGYNQSEYIAAGICEATGIPMQTSALRRGIFTQSQTRLSRFGRWENVDGRFDVQRPDMIAGKGIILVDDVVTTGATLESCAQAILQHNPKWIGVLTLAMANT